MIKKFFQFLFRKPTLWLISKMSSTPIRERIFDKLSYLTKQIDQGNKKLGIKLNATTHTAKYVVMSDLHKGNGNDADDFKTALPNYLAACNYYNNKNFTYIALGDIEELWENDISQVYKEYKNTFEAEKKFINDQKFYKIVGNHDLYWNNTPYFADEWLKKLYGKKIPIYEGILIRLKTELKELKILLTHGHQGDKTSDGNKFSKWFVANVWTKIQAFLDINVNAPSKDFLLRDKHNKLMYEWSMEQNDLLLITGHTHKPVFASLNHIEKLTKELEIATENKDTSLVASLTKELNLRKQEYISTAAFAQKKPSYFNTGCCCYNDGDITVIEIENNFLRLIKWTEKMNFSDRCVLQEIDLNSLATSL